MQVVMLSVLFVKLFCFSFIWKIHFDTSMNTLIVPPFRQVVCGFFLINHSFIQEKIKRKLKPGNACYPMQNLLSSNLLSKNLKIKL